MFKYLGPSRHWLRRSDEASIAVLVAAATAGLIGYWVAGGGWAGRLIEIDQTGPLSARFAVNVNAADEAELMLLPGVGPALAGRIVASRQTSGPFADADDLRRVRGIGPKTVERIRPYLRQLPAEPP